MVESQQAHQQFISEVVEGLQFHPQVLPASEYNTPTNIVQTLSIGERTIRVISPENLTDLRYRVFDTNFPTHLSDFHLGIVHDLKPRTVRQLQDGNSAGRVVEICGVQNGQPFCEYVIVGKNTHRLIIATPSNKYKESLLHFQTAHIDNVSLTQLHAPLKDVKLLSVGTFRPNTQRVLQEDTVQRRYPSQKELLNSSTISIRDLFDLAIADRVPVDALTIATAYMLQLQNDYPPIAPRPGELLNEVGATETRRNNQSSLPLHISDEIVQRPPLLSPVEIQGMDYLLSTPTEVLSCKVGLRKNQAYLALHLETAPTLRYRFLPVLPAMATQDALSLATIQSSGEYNTKSQIMLSYYDSSQEKPDNCIMVSILELKQMMIRGEISDTRMIAAIALTEHYLETEQLISIEVPERTPSQPPLLPQIRPPQIPK